jgi:hypothetical protein
MSWTRIKTPAEDTDDEVHDAEDDDQGEDMDYDDEYPIEAEEYDEHHGATFEGSESGSVDCMYLLQGQSPRPLATHTPRQTETAMPMAS